MIYKGIALTDYHINWIKTYVVLDYDNLDRYLDEDKDWQNIFNRYLLKIKIYKALFNFGIYGLFYSVAILIKG
jgi:hypothetical protein